MKTDNLTALRLQTRFILENAYRFDWSLQGFGLLRLYLPGDGRLHIWDHSKAYYDVSQLHDHLQWGLTSTIVSGQITNQRFAELPTERGGVPISYINNTEWKEWSYAQFKAGMGAKQISEDGTILLKPYMPEVYGPGDSYHQEPSEVHKTEALPGTVTIMQKYPTPDGESARIFWPVGTEWVSAEPRKASIEEVREFAALALKLLNTQ